ncbi:MAG: hypothetical protein RL238_1218 [Actinomycetota bacterium]|jgi:hypothetical protein
MLRHVTQQAIFTILCRSRCGILPSMEPHYDVVWPKSPRGVQRRRAAERLTTLEGARIGFVWDYMFRGEEIFPVIASELATRFPGLEVVGYDTFGNIHGADEVALVEAMPGTLDEHSIDAVVVGNGC